MIYNSTRLIAAAFDEHDVKYRIEEIGDSSVIEAGFIVEAGPSVIARFISKGDTNDVAIRVFGLIGKIPDAKRVQVLEACNRLSSTIRFYKFYLDGDSSVNVEADLPLSVDDSCLGECCFELFARLMHILDGEFHVLAEALYGGLAEKREESGKLLRLLGELRGKPLKVPDGEEERD